MVGAAVQGLPMMGRQREDAGDAVERTEQGDEDVSQRALAGDRRAWDALISRHHRRVVVSLLAKGIRVDRAHELAQEAWTRLIQQQQTGTAHGAAPAQPGPHPGGLPGRGRCAPHPPRGLGRQRGGAARAAAPGGPVRVRRAAPAVRGAAGPGPGGPARGARRAPSASSYWRAMARSFPMPRSRRASACPCSASDKSCARSARSCGPRSRRRAP